MNRTDAICLGIVVLIIVGLVSLFVYQWYSDITKEEKTKKTEKLFVREGDTITFEFTEYIFSKNAAGELTYSVYQTTDEAVAEDDSIPKSITFNLILVNATGAPITREPMTAIVGEDLSLEINPGFNKRMIELGMRLGQTINGIEVLAPEGYGEKNEDLIETIPFLDNIPIYNSINRLAFENEYIDELPLEAGKTFEDHYWGWMIRIDSITNDTVVIKHEPLIGDKVTVFNWEATVENISSKDNKIWLRHKADQSLLNTPIDAEVLEFYKPEFTDIKELITETQQPYPGIITSMENGITIDFNRENIGKSLKYDVTILKIVRD